MKALDILLGNTVVHKEESYFWSSMPDFFVFIARNLKIIKEDVLGLKVGDEVNQIGAYTGGSHPLNREIKFTCKLTYRGIRYEKMTTDGEMNRVMLFELPKEEYPDKVDKRDTYYVALMIIGEELGTPELYAWDYNYNAPRIYRPIFINFDGLTEEEKRAKFEENKKPKKKK